MNNILGMPTLIQLQSLSDTVDLCKELGLEFIELNMNMPQYCPETLDPYRVGKLSNKSGMEFTLHLPEEIDLASFHYQIREGHLSRCKEALEWSAKAGVKLVNMHINSGVFFTLPDSKVWIYGKYETQFITNLIASLSELIELSQKHNIKLCFENAGNFHLPHIENALDYLARREGFGLTWDTGHDAKSGYKERDILLRHRRKIAHMHLHDFDGISDHQVLFTGSINIKEMLAFAYSQNIRVVIETKTADALAKSISKLKELV
ncbi:MAG: sugar phosphate isomerase/epimerase [Clostridia bacterium]|nr:sugar phosphate isomerase/epimerase [Clostridia bacterium]